MDDPHHLLAPCHPLASALTRFKKKKMKEEMDNSIAAKFFFYQSQTCSCSIMAQYLNVGLKPILMLRPQHEKLEWFYQLFLEEKTCNSLNIGEHPVICIVTIMASDFHNCTILQIFNHHYPYYIFFASLPALLSKYIPQKPLKMIS